MHLTDIGGHCLEGRQRLLVSVDHVREVKQGIDAGMINFFEHLYDFNRFELLVLFKIEE